MSTANTIAQLISDIHSRRAGQPVGSPPAPIDRHVAASLTGSGLFLQSEFSTAAELDALAQGSVIRTVRIKDRGSERFFRRKPAGWFFLTNSEGDGWPYTSAEVLSRHSDGTAVFLWDGAKR